MPPIINPLAVHIQTLKRRLIIIGATILVSMMVAFAFSAEMVAWLNRPFPNPLVFYGPTEALFASIKVSFLAAVLASLPIVFYQFWKFVQPALLPREQRWGIPLILIAGALFALGLLFCNLVILPLVIDFFVSFGMDRDITPELSVGTYIDSAHVRMRIRAAFGPDGSGTRRGRVGPAAGQIPKTRYPHRADHFGHYYARCHPLHHDADGGALDDPLRDRHPWRQAVRPGSVRQCGSPSGS